MNLIYLSVVCISPIVGIIFIYNTIRFLINKNKLKSSDVKSVSERINKYRKKSIYSAIILGCFVIFIGIYTRDVNFETTMDYNFEEIDKMVLLGNIAGGNNKRLEVDVEDIMSTLNNYKYSRTFNNNYYEGKIQFLELVIDEYLEWEIVEVFENGHLRRPNGEVYKITSENGEDLYKELEERYKNTK